MEPYERENGSITKQTNPIQILEVGLNRLWNYYLSMDHLLLIMTYVLVLIGMVFVFSASMYQTDNVAGGNSALDYVFSQFRAVLIGSILLFIMPILPEKWYRTLPLIQAIAGLLAFIMLYTALFEKARSGAANWFQVGPLAFQPSELAKVALATLFAWYASFKKSDIIWNIVQPFVSMFNRPIETLKETIQGIRKAPADFVSIIILLISFLALYKMPDFGTILILGLMMILTLGNGWLQQKGMIVIYSCIGGGYLVLRLISHYIGPDLIASGHYGKARIGIFTNPFMDELDTGYQLIQSFTAFSNGGWFGKGLGHGLVKQNHFPAAHTDFIFAIMGEEIGLIGLVCFLVFFFFYFIYIFRIAVTMKNLYRRNLTLSIVIMFLVQSIVNIGGALSLLPLTGVTLPFISFGGTSLMVSLISIGIVQAMLVQEKMSNSKLVNYNENNSVVEWSEENGI